MIWLPPGEPIRSTGEPVPSNTIVGAIELRGRLPGSTRLATGRPFYGGRKEKSVSSLLSRKPPAMSRLPKPVSMVVVIDRALPSASTMTRWLVPGSFSLASGASSAPSRQGGLPAVAFSSEASSRICCARAVR